MDANVSKVIADLLPLLRGCCRGDYGIALGGAHAKGVEDAESDIDLYVFAYDVLPSAERGHLAEQFSADISGVVSWGDDAQFIQGGTDFYYRGQKIEVWFRQIDYIAGIIADCQAGKVTREYVTWTVIGGFFNHCTLSDLYKMVSVEDLRGVIAGWKAAVSHYPPEMKRRIVSEYLQHARFWPENFHYKSAVARCDVIYTTGIVQQVVHNLIQVVFALNETYFPGDKKLDIVMEGLPHKPDRFVQRVKSLLFPASSPDRSVLENQRAELVALLQEVEALAAQVKNERVLR